MLPIKFTYPLIFLLHIAQFSGALKLKLKLPHEQQKQQKHQQERAIAPSIFFPYASDSSGLGLAIALAIPVDDGRGDIFESICIEANYNQYTFSPLTPPPFQTVT